MARSSVIGLFLLRTEGPPPDGGPVMARIEGQLYALAFSDAQRASGARGGLGIVEARPFYVCAANTTDVVRELRAAGARGVIVDYDPHRATFEAALALPRA